MNIIPWKNKTSEGTAPTATEFRSEVNRLFDSFLREPIGNLSETFTAWNRWAPASLDISQTDNTVTVHAELPGVDPNEIDVTVTGDKLTIAGEKKETVEKTSQDVFHRETRYGSFSRTVQLPSSVDPQQVSAEYANGLLTVSLKKTPNATARKIPISTNAQVATS